MDEISYFRRNILVPEALGLNILNPLCTVTDNRFLCAAFCQYQGTVSMDFRLSFFRQGNQGFFFESEFVFRSACKEAQRRSRKCIYAL